MFYAAGFSGGYEKAVALDREDRVIGCRASARMADGLSVRLERWAGEAAPRLLLQSDRLFDIHMTPVDVVADGALFDLSPAGAGGEPSGLGPVAMRLSDEAAAALSRARVAEIDAQGHRIRLPPGLPSAMRFVTRCGA
jgi:hypothetical protein